MCLIEQGVHTVFGYPGGRILPLYDALYDGPIRHVQQPKNKERYYADAYAPKKRGGGRCAYCYEWSQKVTNLVTGLANAYLDSVPAVIIKSSYERYWCRCFSRSRYYRHYYAYHQ